MDHRFSPVAGIQWVETNDRLRLMEYRDQEVSVPLPGFSGLRPHLNLRLCGDEEAFQSRCRDSVG